MTRINDFSGGLNLRVSSSLINISQSVICNNVDVSSLSIKSLKGATSLGTYIGNYFCNFNNAWVSSDIETNYVEFQQKLYRATALERPKKSFDGTTWHNLGIEAPAAAPISRIVASGEEDEDAPEPDISKAVANIQLSRTPYSNGTAFFNISIDASNIGSYYRLIIRVVNKRNSTQVYYYTDDVENFIQNTTETVIMGLYDDSFNIYVELESYSGILISTMQEFKIENDVIELVNDSITTGGYSPNLGSDKAVSGVVYYCYTYYNEEDGSESVPSPTSLELDADDSIIGISVKASKDEQVTHIRLYRLGNTLTEFSLAIEVENKDAEIVDNLSDLAIPGDLLTSQANYPAPLGLKNLIEYNAMFFGSIGDKIYFSDIAYVNSWSNFNFIDFSEEVTGLSGSPNGLLVFTMNKTYIITGTSPSTLSKYLLNGNYGCIDYKSIQFLNNNVIWLSREGICVSNGGTVSVASRNLLGTLNITKNIVGSASLDDCYYLACNNEILIFDTRYGNIFRKMLIDVKGIYTHNNTLYISSNNILNTLLTGNELPITYKSGNITDGSISHIKNYKNAYVYSEGSLNLKVYIDDTIVADKDLNDGYNEVLFNQNKRQGYYLSFEVSGIGTLYEIEWNSEGRQNGR